jgi:hypothetical protein
MAVGIWNKIVAPVPFPSAAYAVNTYYSASPSGGVETAGTKTSYGTNDAWNSIEFTIAASGGGGGTATVRLEGYDPASATWFPVPSAVSTGIASGTTQPVIVSPSIPATANVAIPWILPIRWRLRMVVATATLTVSVGARVYRV